MNCCAASTEHLVPASRYRAFPAGGKANFPLTNMLGAPLHSPTGGEAAPQGPNHYRSRPSRKNKKKTSHM